MSRDKFKRIEGNTWVKLANHLLPKLKLPFYIFLYGWKVLPHNIFILFGLYQLKLWAGEAWRSYASPQRNEIGIAPRLCQKPKLLSSRTCGTRWRDTMVFEGPQPHVQYTHLLCSTNIYLWCLTLISMFNEAYCLTPISTLLMCHGKFRKILGLQTLEIPK